jgi:phosphoribosylanthranilate isomerase
LENKNVDQYSLKPREYHWDIALKAKEYGRIIISGGLNPENIEDAVRFVQPYGIDVSEGIEEKVGKMNPDKMRNFISRSRSIILSYHDDEES